MPLGATVATACRPELNGPVAKKRQFEALSAQAGRLAPVNLRESDEMASGETGSIHAAQRTTPLLHSS